jgi:membrane-bound ClpP family serine protease
VTTFLVIGVLGLVLLLVSLVLGDLLDGVTDVLPGDAFSTAVIGAFVSATGFGAAAADSVGAPTLVAVPVGIVGGLFFGWFAAWLTRLIRDGGSDETPSVEHTLGQAGRVVSDIPAEGLGTVVVLVSGNPVRLNARCAQPLEAGAEVFVTSVLSPTAVEVAPVWNPLP